MIMHFIKINNKFKNTQMANIGLDQVLLHNQVLLTT